MCTGALEKDKTEDICRHAARKRAQDILVLLMPDSSGSGTMRTRSPHVRKKVMDYAHIVASTAAMFEIRFRVLDKMPDGSLDYLKPPKFSPSVPTIFEEDEDVAACDAEDSSLSTSKSFQEKPKRMQCAQLVATRT
ncbi:hypothetical protein FVE85_2797 [Porphyridium purpureum]|uniref:Uncharacterized protein n=1 Tax=Porphyridium purpureum TaxID=35688 RepID=A0A5J4YT94_PORPP|nr:hypothetical protein FVE85_2797 [Porphyridium purpureum]|eukprot:POR3004..scf227_4